MPVAEIVVVAGVTVSVADTSLPLIERAFIVTVPAFLPVTLPPVTVAIFVLLLDQVIFLLVALLGSTLAEKVIVPPTFIDALEGEIFTPVTSITLGVFARMVIVAEAVLPLCDRAVIVAVPTFLPVITPPLTATIFALLLDQVIV